MEGMLVGLCLTLSIPECQAVGHTSVTFPNAFNQTSIEMTLPTFDLLKNESCSKAAMYYLCNMLFPSCDAADGRLSYPCRSHCQAVNEECPGLLVANQYYCDQLPNVRCVKGLSGEATSRKTTNNSASCLKLEIPQCQAVGHIHIKLPNIFDLTSINQILPYFKYYKEESCSQLSMFYLCSFLFPGCDPNTGLQYSKVPCRDHCQAVEDECGSGFELASKYCDQLPQDNCIEKYQGSLKKYTSTSPLLTSTFKTQSSTKNKPIDLITTTETSTTMSTVSTKPGQDAATTAKFENCSLTGQYSCPDGQCIMMSWVCDGEPDCSDQSDETNCSKCATSEYTCLDTSCVPVNERCNKVPACQDQSDERDCCTIRIKANNKQLEVAYDDYWLPVCFHSWRAAYGPLVCQTLGLGNRKFSLKDAVSQGEGTNIRLSIMNGDIFWKFILASPVKVFNYFRFATVDHNGPMISYLGNLSSSSSCVQNQVVSVECAPRGCGERLIGSSRVKRIIGGSNTLPGHWPWQASVQLEAGDEKKHTCGASLISPNFVLTATHCVEYLVSNDLRSIKLGATNRVMVEMTQRKYSIRRVINYNPNFKSFGPGDITLFELTDPVEYTPYIQPVCLPVETEEFTQTSVCYVTGWGYTSPGGKEHAKTLKQLKTKIWKMEKCNGTDAWNGLITRGYLCAGYDSGIRSVCTGDSGGPLVCKNNAGIWKIVGITSYVSTNCNKPSKPNVFTDVKQYIPWIKDQIECKFHCDNGKCIYEHSQLCNKENDCGDNSDEIKPCRWRPLSIGGGENSVTMYPGRHHQPSANISVNCSFDDDFLCGYSVKGFSLVSGPNNWAKSTIPWSDHTFGHYPGHFLVGKVSNQLQAVLTSPRFKIISQSCVSFYYNVRGRVQKTIFIQAFEYSSSGGISSRPVWNLEEGEIEDSWKLGHFDLSAGEYQLTFTIVELFRIGLDDVKVIPGFCSSSVCPTGSHICSNKGDNAVCVHRSSICNVVKDCNKDENNCPVEETKYSCDFESVVHCGISQMTDDTGEWLLVNGSYLRERILYDQAFNDHTSNVPKGWMLFVMTNQQREVGDSVKMKQKLHLNNQQFCLSFFYQCKTEMNFKVEIESKGAIYPLWKFSDRTTVDWTKAQVQLPAVNDVVVTYELTRTSVIIHNYFKPYVALDDISIVPGLCPNYECPADWRKCDKEDYCYPPEYRCDRKVHCQDESDEANCACTEFEFSCGNGRCINKDKTCNAVVDCLDKSDEGSLCDPYRGVSCNFDSPFICGYTSISHAFMWLRKSGTTGSYFTGPSADHTSRDAKGYYMYAEGTDGQRGDLAILTSPSLKAVQGQSLSFFFNIRTKSKGIHISSEGMYVKAWLTSTEKRNLWWSNETTGDQWKYACTDLPADKEMTIQFIAKRKGLDSKGIYDADVAIDDVVLRNVSCSEVYPKYTTTTRIPTDKSSGCATDQFRCNNGFCLSKFNVCDDIPDCINGEDEFNCYVK